MIPILITMISRFFPTIKSEEKIGDIAAGLSGCIYSIGDFGGPFLGGLLCNLL